MTDYTKTKLAGIIIGSIGATILGFKVGFVATMGVFLIVLGLMIMNTADENPKT